MPLEPSSEPTAAIPSATSPAPNHPEGNIKETIESILVAFILAFVFRAFVVEAFVIPTGSMAPTLMGAHMRFHCPDCGYEYDVNFSSGGDSDISIPSRVSGKIGPPIYCPNCGYAVPDVSRTEDSRTDTPIQYGDRILVLKYRYLLSDPKRWDVIVFKSPDAPPRGEPNATYYTTNYIKRLIGRPGESIMVLDGDIYVSRAAPPLDLNDENARDDFLRTFEIQRKPAYAQDVLWRTIYDNDYLPHLPPANRAGTAWKQPWMTGDGAGWNLGENLASPNEGRTRVFAFDNGNSAGSIRFQTDSNARTAALTDFLAYDQLGDSSPGVPVSDLKLSCLYRRESGAGALKLTLAKHADVFVAEVTPGKISLVHSQQGTGRVFKRYPEIAVPDLDGNAEAKIEFANVDYRVSIRINGKEVLATGDEYGPAGDGVVALVNDERSGANQRIPPRVEIGADSQKCTLQHLVLSRDIYYLNAWNDRRGLNKGNSVRRGSPDTIVTLKGDEYFAMGDNSLMSSDGRMWGNDVSLPGEDLPFVAAGRVPARFLLGKAFFVYWPAGHRPFGLDWGIIPNFGEMRFIH